jgi:Calx-beta domain
MRAQPISRWRGAAILLVVAASTLGAARVRACLSDSDCDDGQFCTTEHCILFVCARGERDCNDFNDCTQDSCDESRNACVHENLHLTKCDDFNIFTANEVCCAAKCEGIPIDIFQTDIALGDRCCVSADCGFNEICVDTVCIADTEPQPTLTPTRTPTRTPTPTRTNTRPPDTRPVLTIDDVAGNEGNSGFRSFVFTAMLSRTINQEVHLLFSVSDGSAIAGSDYFANTGPVTIPRNTLSFRLPPIAVEGDVIPEADETFFVHLTNVSTNVRVADPTGKGIIVNDDKLPFFIPGVGALSPRDGVAHVGQLTPLTLTWTSPRTWHDLSTLDLRLRGQRGIALWVRFDESANSLGLIRPSDVSLGPAFAPGSVEELAGESVALILGESNVESSAPDAPSVALTFTLRFDPAAAGNAYVVDAAAIDDEGDVQDFDTIGTITVASPPPCPGDCNRDGVVDVVELVRGVDIALGTADLASCPDLDTNDSGAVEVDELVAAINAALAGCGGL